MDLKSLTPEQKAALFAELEQERLSEIAQKENERKQYKQLSEEAVESCFPTLENMSSAMSDIKKTVFDTFKTVIELKSELYKVKSEQRSHTFINAAGNKRITVGYRVLDRYDNTAEAGFEKIKQYLESLTGSINNELSAIINNLLKRDSEGNMKASRVLELQKIAKEINDPLFLDGVKIIADAYKPDRSANFITAEYKNEIGVWNVVPLSVSSVDFAI